MSELLASHVVDDEESRKNAFIVFNRCTSTLFNELYEEEIKISIETNSIRLISSPEIDMLLDELELAVKKSTDDTSKMITFMATPEFFADQTLIAPYRQRAEESGKLVPQCRDKLRSRMKYELNKI